ncbi:MAG: hypothetical protein ACR2FS_02600 [Phormidesmis sp.]
MTTANNRPSVCTEGSLQGAQDSAQQRLSAAEATANQLNLPDWSQISDDGIYRCGYIVTLRTQALQWKVQATERALFETCYYSEATGTLFVQTYSPECLNSVHLRGKIQHQQYHAAIDIRGSCTSLRVGECLGTLGERWADWRLLSLEVAEKPGF